MDETETAAAGLSPYCRHCGVRAVPDPLITDWFCQACEHWQDTIACPVCGQPARISLMPADLAPPPHAPVKE